ncbi:MAG: serine--tRNA ligase [Patescibacteria group bacterium]
MLDIKFIREHPLEIKAACEKKHHSCDIDRLLQVDGERKELNQKIDELRAKQNEASVQIAQAQGEKKQQMIDDVSSLKDEIHKIQEKLKPIQVEWDMLMLQVPQVPAPEVPEGASDKDNLEIKAWGEKPNFDFVPKSHIDIMTTLGMVDFERGAKVHGFRGYYLVGDGARLSWAIWNYAQDFFLKKGFIPMLPPVIVREENLYGTGHLPNDAEDVYNTQDNDYLIGTAEIPLTGFHSGEILQADELPKKYLGFSPCFRREAGSYGKDTKGLIRVHEFYKVEQVILCSNDKEESEKYHEWINHNTEEFIESLGIPYHTVLNCGGDLGQGQVKKYDIELWVPGEQSYREISSASAFYDFQARRFNIRYKDKEGATSFVYTLNSTAIPTPRILVSLVENYQNRDGSVTIPEVLRPYMGGQEIIT